MSQGTTRGIPIDRDTTFVTASHNVVPSQLAVKTYADTKLSISSTSSMTVLSASYSQNAFSASYAPGSPNVSASYSLTASYSLNAPNIATGSTYNITSSWATASISSSYSVSSSFSSNSLLFNGTSSRFFATTGSNNFIGSQTVTGSLFSSGSNNLIGDSTVSGNLVVSGSRGTSSPSIKVYGDFQHDGYVNFLPVTTNINPSISSSYIYVSGSTNDLYFSQNGNGFNNTTRLRWLESDLYTGILHGGVISSTPGTNTFSVTSGSGIIVSLNALTSSAPYPTIRYLNWSAFLNQPLVYSGSAYVTYVGISSSGELIQQSSAWGSSSPAQWESSIHLGEIFHLSASVSTNVFNNQQISYGVTVQMNDFVRAFGPMKLSGNVLQTSGSTLGIRKSSGTSFLVGANYINDPDHPSTVVDSGVNNCRINRYYQSGSSFVIDSGPLNAGYTVLDNTKYVNTSTGQLATVASGRYSIQRVFWAPNTNGFFNVYYGNDTYKSISEAQSLVDIEAFSESPDTALNNIYLGYVIVKGGTVTSLSGADALIVQSGLFRQVSGVGATGGSNPATTLESLSNVSSSNLSNGDLLVYSGSTWINSKSFSGSYRFTGSFDASLGSITGSLLGTSSNATTASYALNAPNILTGSTYFITSSWSTSSVSSSYSVNSGTSLTSSYVAASNVFGTVTSSSFSVSASYANTSSVSLTSSVATSASFAVSASAYLPLVGGTLTDQLTISNNGLVLSYDAGTRLISFPSSTGFRTNGGVLYCDSVFGIGNYDVILARDNANILALRNTGSGQTFNVYGTYTNTSNFVRAALSASSTSITLASESSGSGASNVNISIKPAGSGVVDVIGNQKITGSLSTSLGVNSAGGFTGSLVGTASVSTSSSFSSNTTTALTSSYITSSNVFGMVSSASYALNAPNISTGSSYNITSSWASNVVSSSYSLNSGTSNTSSYVTSSNVFGIVTSSSFSISGSYVFSSSRSISASYAFSSSRAISSSWAANAPIIGSGSRFYITSSWATSSINSVSSSWADYAMSASYAPGSPSVSSSYSVSGSWADYAMSASYAPGSPSVSASYAETSSYTDSAAYAESSSYAASASYAVSASSADSSSAAWSSSYAVSASSADSSSAAWSSSYAVSASSTDSSSFSISSSYAYSTDVSNTSSYITSSNISGVVISASWAKNAPNISTGSKYNITSSWATSSVSSSFISCSGQSFSNIFRGNSFGVGTSQGLSPFHYSGSSQSGFRLSRTSSVIGDYEMYINSSGQLFFYDYLSNSNRFGINTSGLFTVGSQFMSSPMTSQCGIINTTSSNSALLLKAAPTQSQYMLAFSDASGNQMGARFKKNGVLDIGTDVSDTVNPLNGNGKASIDAPSLNWGIRTGTSKDINFDVYNSGLSASALNIMQSGQIGVNGPASSSQFYVNCYTGSRINSIFKGASGQSVSLAEYQNSNGFVLNKIGSDGSSTYYSGSFITITQRTSDINNSCIVFNESTSAKNTYAQWADATTFEFYNGDSAVTLRLRAANMSAVNIYPSGVSWTVKGAASQAGDMQRWVDSSGNTLSYIDSTGRFFSTDGTSSSPSIGFKSGSANNGFYLSGVNAISIATSGSKRFTVDNSLTLSDGFNLVTNTSNGSKICTDSTQKLGFWNATPIIQPSSSIAASTFSANTSLISNDSATWDGYTIGQVVKALRNLGILS